MTAPRVLVTAASAAGSTQGIADRIAARLAGAGLDVVARPLAPDTPVDDVDAVVVGSAVHDMAWLLPARAFLDHSAAALRGRPLWCFSVGGLPHPDRGPVSRRMAARELDRVARGFPPGLAPVEHRLFPGVVETGHLPLWGKLFWRAFGGRAGDRRDWPAVDAWADGIAGRLSAVRGLAPS